MIRKVRAMKPAFTLTEAKLIADAVRARLVIGLNYYDCETLRAAHRRLQETEANGGVRNSERAAARLKWRLEAIENEIERRTRPAGLQHP